MDECFDLDTTAGISSTDVDVSDIAFEPLDNVSDVESIFEQGLSELISEAEALNIEPFEETVYGIYDNIGDVDFKPSGNDREANAPSTLDAILAAAMLNTPSIGARGITAGINALTGGRLDPIASEPASQFVQMSIDAVPAAIQGMTEGIIAQHGVSVSAKHNHDLITHAIADGVEASGRTEPLENTLRDNEPIFDENGIDLTDERFRE